MLGLSTFVSSRETTCDRAFAYQLKALDEKFKKAFKRNRRNRENPKTPPIDEFRKIIWILAEENKNYHNYQAVSNFFEDRVLPEINVTPQHFSVWVDMIEVYLNMKQFKKARKCRRFALQILQKSLFDCQFNYKGQENCVANPYKKLFPCTKQGIFIVDEEFEHSVCISCVQVIEDAFGDMQFRMDQIAAIHEAMLIWAGRMSMLQENYSRALDQFRKASKVMKFRNFSLYHKPKTFVFFQAAECFMKLQRYEFAIKTFVKCISSQDPEDDGEIAYEDYDAKPNLVNCARMTLGHLYYISGHHKKAAMYYQEALKSMAVKVLVVGCKCCGDTPTVYLDPSKGLDNNPYDKADFYLSKERLESFYRMEKTDEDLDDYQKDELANIGMLIDAVENGKLHSPHVDLLYDFLDMCEVWMLTHLKGKFEKHKIMKLYKTRAALLISIDQNNTEYDFTQIYKKIDNKNIGDFQERAVARIRKLGNDYEALMDLKIFYSGIQDKEEKFDALQLIVKIKRKYELYSELVDFLSNALSDFEDDVCDDHSKEYQLLLAKSHFQSKNFNLAAEEISKMLELGIENFMIKSKCFETLGRCYHELCLYEKAIQCFDESTALKKQRNRSYLLKARTLMLLKEYKKARELVLEKTNWPKNILAQILLTITAKLMQLPYEDCVLKTLKICQKSLIPLKKTLWISPLDHVRLFLDTLVQASNNERKYQYKLHHRISIDFPHLRNLVEVSKCERKYQTFRSSYLIMNLFRESLL